MDRHHPPYTGAAQYAPSLPVGSRGAHIVHIDAGSPAHLAGLEAGMTLTSVDGEPLQDSIDWLWLSDGTSIEVEGFLPGAAADQSGFSCEMVRTYPQPWGIDFAEPIFDGVRTCVNNCAFCFMTMLPQGMRPALSIRDDDYRLSFLQGNFVTLTNLDDHEVERIIALRLSPLHVSLHAIDPLLRQTLIGRNQARGIEVLERLLAAGIEVHAQIVLIPDINDGLQLTKTLDWIESRTNIVSVGIVPLGYTRYWKRSETSFETPVAAQRVIEQVALYRTRSREATGLSRFHLSDEFYLIAYPDDTLKYLPPEAEYDGFAQYEDGIGLLRTFADEWLAARGRMELLSNLQHAGDGNIPATLVCGTAFAHFFTPLLKRSPLRDTFELCAVENTFFGGNVDVTGLLTAQDVIVALKETAPTTALLPAVMFNDDGITLDDVSAKTIAQASGKRIDVVSCTTDGLLGYLEQLA